MTYLGAHSGSTLIDPSVGQILSALDGLAREESSLVDEIVASWVTKSGYPRTGILDPDEAWDYFTAMRIALEEYALEVAARIPSIDWLWYLRRVPLFRFGGSMRSTPGYVRGLTDVLSGTSTANDGSRRLELNPGQVALDCSPYAVRPVLRIIELAGRLAMAHSALRRAGKGTRYALHNRRPPTSLPNDSLERAISTYDERMENDSYDQRIANTLVGQSSEYHESDSVPLLGVASLGLWPLGLPGWSGIPAQTPRRMTVEGQFYIQPMESSTLAGLVEPITGRHEKWWPPDVPAVWFLLQSLFLWTMTMSPTAGMQLLRVGYLMMDRTRLHGFLEECMPTLRPNIDRLFPGGLLSTVSEILSALASTSGSFWPLSMGSLVREGEDIVLVDVWNAALRLRQSTMIDPKSGGELTNRVGAAFEADVQNVIRKSTWNPSKGVEALRGRRLRRNGRFMADIDAIGERDDVLLLVSCKGFSYTEEYDAGVPSAVKNIEHSLRQAVSDWGDFLAKLRHSPVGDNYDLGDRRLLGVVVTPHVFFSTDGEVLGEPEGWPGLRAAVSVGELQKWLLAE